MSDWISVDDQLPEEGVIVNSYHPDWGVSQGYLNAGCIEIGLLQDCATLWMPLPIPPKHIENKDD